MQKQYKSQRAATELLCHYEIAERSLVPTRRMGAVAAIAVFLLLASVLVLFLQVQGFLNHLETKLAAESHGDPRLHAITQQVEALQGKFSAVLAESVEIRLKTLEQNIANGKAGPDDLKTFESLKSDLKLLENYAGRTGNTLGFDYARQEHPRYRAVVESQHVWRNDELHSALLELKNVFYACLGTLAMSLLMLGGYWLWQRGRIRRLEAPALPPLLVRQTSGSRR